MKRDEITQTKIFLFIFAYLKLINQNQICLQNKERLDTHLPDDHTTT